MESPIAKKLTLSRKVASPRTGTEECATPERAWFHVGIQLGFPGKLGAFVTELPGIKFHNMFILNEHPGTSPTYTELIFLEPETSLPDEAPTLTETGAPCEADVQVGGPSGGTRTVSNQPPDAWTYRAAGSQSVSAPFEDTMPREAHPATPHPGGYIPWPQAYPLPHHNADAESRSSLEGWSTSPPEHVVETAYLSAWGRSNFNGVSSPTVPPALGYDHYRYAGGVPPDEVYATNRWDSGISQMLYMPSQPSAVTDERGFAPQPFMHDADRLRHGATQALGIPSRSGACHYLDTRSVVWPSENIPRHKQIQTVHNETAQDARFGVVHSLIRSCGRNAHEHVGCIYASETIGTSSSWDHTSTDAYRPVPPTHTSQEQWTPEDPVSTGSASDWGEYQCYAPVEDVARAQMTYGLDPGPSANYSGGLPGANIDGANVYPAPVEGFDGISTYAGESVPPGWGMTETSAGPSYQGTLGPWC
ncbi:hypothetical protein C8Q78DRAFT_357266 [Trametes maxima]|nr:hypothetical protein C8Q78DRAFT_357266 [Trametes maxima]